MQVVTMPSVGVAMTEGTLLRWLRRPGDAIAKGDVLAEIETDKVNVELQSPVDGHMGSLLVTEGATVPVGTPLTELVVNPDSSDTAALDTTRPGDMSTSREPTEPSLDAAEAQDAEAGAARRLRKSPRARWLDARGEDDVVEHAVNNDASSLGPTALRSESTVPRKALTRKSSELNSTGDAGMTPIEIGRLPSDDLQEWLSTMLLIREFDTVADRLCREGRIPGSVHTSTGQEAIAVGAIRALKSGDRIVASHRSHHHAIAAGVDLNRMMAELWGKADGCCAGRGGSMHIADFSRGYWGSNGIVGSSVGIGMGMALASALRGSGDITLAFVGDGAANTGRTWESINMAAIWKLPLVVVCENNLYAVSTFVGDVTASETIAERARGFGVNAVVIDGQDIGEVYSAVNSARQRALDLSGPTFIEALTYRYLAHSTGQTTAYRPDDELERWRRTKDPIERLARALTNASLATLSQIRELGQLASQRVQEAARFAEASPFPEPTSADDNVYGMKHSVRRAR